MKKITNFIIMISICSFGQITESTEVKVGYNAGDITGIPIDDDTNLSHSQVIYFQDELKFRGYIKEISFYTVFSNPTTTDVPISADDLTIKLGMTNVGGFSSSYLSVPNEELTQVTNVLRSTSGYEVRYTFETSFYYDGVSNLVVDFEDINPEVVDDYFNGYKCAENINPPNRSFIERVSIYEDGSEEETFVIESTLPETLFKGDFEKCYDISVDFTEKTSTSVKLEFTANEHVSLIKYKLSTDVNSFPENYQTTTDRTLVLTELLPSQQYYIKVKSDCDEIPSSYTLGYFETRSSMLSIPYTIDFEEDVTRDFMTDPSIPNGIEINYELGTNNIVKMYGLSYPGAANWSDNGSPFQDNDDYYRSFVKSIILDVDLIDANNPILQFDLKQSREETYFRVLVSSFGEERDISSDQQGSLYQNITEAGSFRKVIVDLSSFIGKKVTIKLQHVSPSKYNISYIDNIELKENVCSFN